jgi:hypothetical protein
MSDASWERYEHLKAAWIAAHPAATPEEYEQAAIREFRGDKLRTARSTDRKAGFPAQPATAFQTSGMGK